MASLHPRQSLRLSEISSFFDAPANLEVLVRVATQTGDVSLRALDFCCTNYAKKTRVVLSCRSEDGQRAAVHLFSLYKDWLRHYRRRAFDPFRRRERIYFEHPSEPGVQLETTVAQLNFLRWASIYGVLDFVRRNTPAIERDMNATLSRAKKRPPSEANDKKHRSELSRAPTAKCIIYEMRHDVAFDSYS